MDQAFTLALHLQKNSLSPADLRSSKRNFNNNQLFIVAYAYYLLTLDNERTKVHYRTVIDHFIRFMLNTINKMPLDAIGLDVLLWREDMIRTGGIAGTHPSANLDRYWPQEKSSIHNKVCVLSAFYKFLQKPGLDGSMPLIYYNPVDALRERFKIEKYARSKKISIEVLKNILNQLDTNNLRELRNYVLIYGYFMTGRRNSEWVTLKWGQINFDTDPISFSFIRKGEKITTDEMPKKLLDLLLSYLKKRWGDDFHKKISEDTYLFTAIPEYGEISNNKSLSERSMLRILKTSAKKAGINPDKINVHSLRHLHAESYLKAGATVEEICARLGHQSLATTQIYISAFRNDKNRLANELDNMLNDINPIDST